MASTMGAALPSNIGISTASVSISTLSKPKPTKAERKCSTVATRASPLPKTVPREESTTFSTHASMQGLSAISVRLN